MRKLSGIEPSDVIRVLVPAESKPLLDKAGDTGLLPVFYEIHSEPLAHKVRRKLGLLKPSRGLDMRLSIADPGEGIRECVAFWLSPSLYLPQTQMSALLERLPRLGWVYSQMTGTEHLDVGRFRQQGIMVSNAGNLSSRRVAEMALANILSHAKRLPEHQEMQRVRKWKSLPCRDLAEQAVGIIGTGNIGREVAGLCGVLGMRVIGASRDPARQRAESPAFNEVVSFDDLEALLQQSDYVVLTLPLNNETKGLIGREELSTMKTSACLVNVSRGAIIDEDALCDALSRGTIGAAYIDVPRKIPPSRRSRLYRAPNMMLTHYSSANSRNVMSDAFQQFISGVAALREGHEPPNRVV